MKRAFLALAGLALGLPWSSAEAGSVSIRLGQFAPRGESDIWDENVQVFDLVVDDFHSLLGGAEFAAELNEFLDVAIGVAGYRTSVDSSYREFVRDDGTEIEQEIRLSVAPLTAGLRFLPIGKFRPVLPYVTGGLGLYPYDYREEGEFIDFTTFEIFGAAFRDRGLGTGVFAGAGVEVPIRHGILVFGEVRRHWAGAELGGDFEDFGELDLDATEVVAGFTVRF